MNLLITGAWQGYAECKDKLIKARHNIRFMQWEKDPLPCKSEWVEGIIGNGIFLSHPIEQFVNLKYIQLTSAGFDRVPMDYVKEHQIEIHNARGVYSIPMAEFAIGGVLQLYKSFPQFRKSQEKHEWNKIRKIREIYGKEVLIIGCGNVGTECAVRFKGLGCNVFGVDLYPTNNPAYLKMHGLDEIDQALKTADIIVMTVPLTKETKGLLNKERILSFKEHATIVNIARGGVMDYSAFAELKSTDRKDLYGVFDVFEEEPLSADSPIWEMDDVIATPHNSFVGEGNTNRLNILILSNVLAEK